MRPFLSRSLATKEQSNGRGNRVQLYLNVYDLTPINNYLYWFGLGIYHSGIEVHGMEYAFGAHEYPTSGVFEVEPRCCPGFVFRRSVLLGSTDMSRSEFRLFMEHFAGKYHGDSYHLIAKNCNHFTDDVCMRLTGKPIPGWVNRLARLEDGSDSIASSAAEDSEEDSDHHLLASPNGDVAFINERPMRLAKELL
ncbi:deSI-like protein At4g17486 isoform X7 [Telopea speciosissima]|uniref:deSI-like protein At4g17486 isoform X7 n=1 Tax=Telopea speciosissima TaxID=54955 RepID=UPI001CC79693|nr:deSI-like protein At4g17486 isoform X7 [Telopea speciosissima]